MKFAAFYILITFGFLFISCKDKDPSVDPEVEEETSKPASAYSSTVVREYADLQLKMINNTPGYSSPVAARSIAYLSLAAYEAMAPGMEKYQSLAGQLQGLDEVPQPEAGKEYHWGMVVNASQYYLMKNLYSTSFDVLKAQMDTLRKKYEVQFDVGIGVDAKERSIRLGNDIGMAIWEYAKKDGGHEAWNNNFPQSNSAFSGPSKWQPTGAEKKPLLPQWKDVRSFLAKNSSITSNLEKPFSFNADSEFFAEAQQVYGTAKNINEAQKSIMQFWYDPVNTSYTPAGHQLAVINSFVNKENYTLDQAAVLYLKIGIAMHDATVTSFKQKYATNIMRPQTYINESIDPSWQSHLAASPSPAYTSAQATLVTAVAEILNSEFGENYVFEDNTKAGTAPKRAFKGFGVYAKEARQAQLYAGITYPMSVNKSEEQGKEIATNVLELKFEAPVTITDTSSNSMRIRRF